MRILYYNNCWFTNVGEAFIDIGAMEMLRRAVPGVRLANISNMTAHYVGAIATGHQAHPARRWFNRLRPLPAHSIYSAARDFEADAVVLAGMVATREFLTTGSCAMIREFARRGTRLILIGVGASEYSEAERAAFRNFLRETPVAGLIARDPQTHEACAGQIARCFPGIDCAFWVPDAFDPRGFARNQYDVVSFCRSPEPAMFAHWPRDIIRPFHFQFGADRSHLRPDMLISDSPYDYLTVYANARHVHTDLVHGAIISLAYDIPIKYYHDSPRARALHSLEELETGAEGFLRVSRAHLELKKTQMIERLRTILESI